MHTKSVPWVELQKAINRVGIAQVARSNGRGYCVPCLVRSSTFINFVYIIAKVIDVLHLIISVLGSRDSSFIGLLSIYLSMALQTFLLDLDPFSVS
jgi:hypothetical protein